MRNISGDDDEGRNLRCFWEHKYDNLVYCCDVSGQFIGDKQKSENEEEEQSNNLIN